jgi:hypothetical protein
MSWALRQRRRGYHEAQKAMTDAAMSLANYMVEAQRIAREGEKIARTTRRLTWAISGLTLVNVVFVAYDILK